MRGKKPCLLSRCLSALLAAVLVIGLVGYAPEAKAATKEITEDAFLKAANSKIGSATAQGMCLGWVRSFWVGLGAESSTSCCAHNYSLGSGRIVSTSKNNIPIGANIYFRGGSAKCVYSNGGGCGRICGHIGIHMGDGKVISARKLVNQSACVGVETISKWESWGYTYVGWGWHTGVKVVDDDCTTIDSKTRIGVSKKEATGEDQCYVKERPYENSNDKSDSVPKGNTVKIVGAVKNKYGNTWYKTASGGFVWEGDVTVWEYSNLFSLSANFKNKKDQNTHDAPYADSDKIKAYPAGKSFEVKAFVTNSYGNIWAELADGGFMNFYDKGADRLNMEFVSHVTNPSISEATKPSGNINVTNQGFWLKGTVKSGVPFLSVSTRIINRETGKDVEGRSPISESPSASTREVVIYKKNDSNCLDSRTKFNNLPKGWYQYQLNAQFGFTYEGKTFKFGGAHNFITSDFTVGNPGTLETTPTPEVKGNLTIGNATKNGDVLEIPIGIQGNPGLMGIGIKVDLPEDFWNFNVSPVDIGKDAIPYTEGVNGGDTVALMSMGTMTGDGNLFKIHVSTAGIDLTEFTLKVTCVSAGDANGKDVMFTGAEKTIQLSSNRTPGDANDDGAVDWADVILALKYTMKLNVSINLENAEVTADGIVDWSDVILLLKYVMKLNVQLQ